MNVFSDKSFSAENLPVSPENIRLIVTDLDGTLMNAAGVPSERTLKMIARCAEAGIALVPVTGRHYDVGSGLREIRDIPYILSANGARCFDNRTGETLFFSGISREDSLRVLDLLREVPCQRRVFVDRGIIGEEGIALYENARRDRDLYEVVSAPGAELEKLDITFDDQEVRRRCWKAVEEQLPGIRISAAWPWNMELNGPEGDKGSGVLRLAKHLGLTAEQVMAFGDYLNDIPMIRAAGIGVAMENAVPEARSAADLIAPPNTEDGEARVVEALVLGYAG